MSGRALVLGSGGLTGLAWQAGVLDGLAAEGVSLSADLIVGTSAGALLGARLADGTEVGDLLDRMSAAAGSTSLAWTTLARLFAAQLYPSRRHALAWLGRRAATDWTQQACQEWVEVLTGDLAGCPWPEPLVVVATHARSGRPAFLSAGQPTDLAAAVAASCAVPGAFPAVRIEGQLYLDGGLRSPANIDVAGSADSVLALSPLTSAVRAHRRPREQAAQLRRDGVAVTLLTPDAAGRRAIGVNVLAAARVPMALAAGQALGVRRAERVRAAWAS